MRPIGLAMLFIGLNLAGVSISSAQEVEASATVVSPTPTPPVVPAEVRESQPEEKMVCRNEKQIGSNRSTRVCRTAASREEAREDTLDALRHRRGTPRGDAI
ncbi:MULTISPECIES: hypothetical protein [Luteimonas]|uniref:hypothetical protein n=1 Tax=Luteimonas TaxID=83614 RepID=UPI00117F8E5B|nr:MULTISPECIES: hypothetical protein [Luteimonas]